MECISNTYYIKNEEGKLVLISEESLVTLIKNKTIKPSTQLFCKTFHKWMKASDLSVYKNISKVVNLSQSEEKVSFTEVTQDNDPSYLIAQLIDKVQDAKTIVFKTRQDQLQAFKKYEDQKTLLEAKIHNTNLSLKVMSKENTELKKKVANLEKDYLESINNEINQNKDLKKTKLEAEVVKLKKELKIININYNDELKRTEKLLAHIDRSREEVIELFDLKEKLATENLKLHKEQKYYDKSVEAHLLEVESARKHIESLQGELDDISSEHRSFIQNHHEELEKLRKAQVYIHNLENEKEYFIKEKKNLLDRNLKLEESLFKTKQEYQDQLNLFHEMQVNFDEQKRQDQAESYNLKIENESLTRQVLQIQNELDDKANYIQKLSEDHNEHIESQKLIIQLEHEKRVIIDEKEITEHRNVELSKDIEALKEKNDELNEQVTYLKDDLTQANISITELKMVPPLPEPESIVIEKVDEVGAEIKLKLEQKCAELENKDDQLKTKDEQIKQYNIKVEQLNNQIEATKTSTVNSDLHNKIVKELKLEKKKNQGLLERAQNIIKKHERLMTELDKLKKENILIKKEMEQKQAQEENNISWSNEIADNEIEQKDDNLLILSTDQVEKEEASAPQLRTLDDQDDEKLEPVSEENSDDDEGTIELCEIENGPVWSIKGNAKLSDQYTIQEMRKMHEDGILKDTTFIKKAGEWWKRYNQYYELLIPITPIPTDNGIKIYIKKQRMRVPINEMSSIQIDDRETHLEILNVSIGGCQAKAPSSKVNILKVGKPIRINFQDDSILKGAGMDGIIRRIEEDGTGSYSIGVQFLSLDNESKTSINEVLTQFTEKISKAA